MTTHSTLRAAVIAALASLALAACDRDATTNAERPGATVGQKIDNALDKTQQSLADAGTKTEQKLDEAGQKISAATDRAVAGTKEAATDMKNATVTAANDVKTEVTTGQTGRAIDDAAITASVKTDLLKDPDLSVLKIDVDTKDGVVTLNGLAGNDEARKRAEKMASSVKGVKEVRNFLVIKRA
ncbi:MAG: BON domain-containing protein [Usitatibacter sp.]